MYHVDFFGDYCKEVFEETLDIAKDSSISINVIPERIIHMYHNGNYELTSEEGTVYINDYLVLCTGMDTPNDPYCLSQSPNFVLSPYPINRIPDIIPESSSVTVLGTGLTGIDVAVSLTDQGHKGPIYMVSRQGLLPAVRSHFHKAELLYLNSDSCLDLASKSGYITLRQIVGLLDRECQRMNTDWKLVFQPSRLKELDKMIREVNNHQTIANQTILASSNSFIELVWKYLHPRSKTLFLQHYFNVFMMNRNPMPLKNALKLHQLQKNRQLKIKGGLKYVGSLNRNGFLIQCHAHQKFRSDYIINAMGPGREVNAMSKLNSSIISNGYVQKDPFGGLKVDFDTNSAIGSDNVINPTFRIIGHLTSGTYLYTGSVSMTIRHSRIAAEQLVNYINEPVENGVLV